MVKEGRGSRVAQPIREWVEDNICYLMTSDAFSSDDVDHIVMCLEHLYRHYWESYPVGDFLSAVAENNLSEAVLRADDVNRRALYLYVLFQANMVPFAFVQARRVSEKALCETRNRGVGA